jgi:glycosyltransferase involved in cell wall biosynthesis
VWNYGMFGFPLLAEVVERRIPLVLVVGDLWPCWGTGFDPWTSMFVRSRHRRVIGRMVERVTGIATRFPDLGAHAVALPASEWLRMRIARDSPFTFARMTVVPHGFDTVDFPIVDPRSESDDTFAWQLLLPGRLDERKGWRTAIRALVDLPEASLTLAGGGDEREIAAVGAVAAEVGVADRVHHVVLDRPDMAARYRAADVVVFPSEWDEPFGIVGLEAMACATPVVATGTGGSSEYLHHQSNCLLFPPGDPHALAASVRRLAGDASLRRRLVEAGQSTARALTADTTVRELEAWHAKAITAWSL